MNMISPDHMVLLVSVEATIEYGLCPNHPFSERYTVACQILSTLVIISLKHRSHIKRN